MLSRENIKVLRYLVSLAIETRTDVPSDDTPFATLSSLEAKLTQMEISDDQANKFRRANQK
jgi:hypothetical protein|tara:strand:+ start:673 stop:855 length:183 start_codon:yes stop_codon:yes gene_type:complete